jgi:hypothetical protein
MPTFENGWICRECWCANRETDERCYRCHAVPKRHEMPEGITFSTPDGKPNEDRPKVSSLTGPPVPRAAEEPVRPPMAATPVSERIRELVLLARLRAAIAAIVGAFTRVVTFGRAVGHAPGAGARLVSSGVRGAKEGANSRARSALSHRRAWLSAAWVISFLSCALLFSVALNAPLPASLLVVASVAIFSGLTAAITTNYSDRRDRRAGDMREQLVGLHEVGQTGSTTPASHSAQPAEVLGGRATH